MCFTSPVDFISFCPVHVASTFARSYLKILIGFLYDSIYFDSSKIPVLKSHTHHGFGNMPLSLGLKMAFQGCLAETAFQLFRSEERATLDVGVLSLSPTWGVEIT